MDLRKRRKALGFSLAELASRVGSTQPYLSMLETGKRSRLRLSGALALNLARELQATPEEIMGLRPRKAVA